MSNLHPVKTRQPKKKRGRNGSLPTAQRVLWAAILRVEEALAGETNTELIVRCTHALSQSLASYSKLVEMNDLEERLKLLEAKAREEEHYEYQ